jgi:hypothetical protein
LIAQTVAEEVEEGHVLASAGKVTHYAIILIRGKVGVEDRQGMLIAEQTKVTCWAAGVLTRGMLEVDVTLVTLQTSLVLKLSKRAYQSALSASSLIQKLKEEEHNREEDEDEDDDENAG